MSPNSLDTLERIWFRVWIVVLSRRLLSLSFFHFQSSLCVSLWPFWTHTNTPSREWPVKIVRYTHTQTQTQCKKVYTTDSTMHKYTHTKYTCRLIIKQQQKKTNQRITEYTYTHTHTHINQTKRHREIWYYISLFLSFFVYTLIKQTTNDDIIVIITNYYYYYYLIFGLSIIKFFWFYFDQSNRKNESVFLTQQKIEQWILNRK